MHKRFAVILTVAAIVLSGLTLALPAYADDRPQPSARPPEVVLRHVDASRASAPSAATSGRELVVLVGGYQSCSCQDDPRFGPLRAALETAGYDVVQFGRDPRFPYDTYGQIAPNAANLRDEVRALAPGYAAVHLVTHSMGGAVADQAFAAGLSRADGVATYVALSAPHSGSTYGRAIDVVHTAAGDDGGLLHTVPLYFGLETSSDALRDLATLAPIRAPAGVVRLDLREMTDLLVPERDASDPGVPSRVLTGALEGHGGILDDRQAIDLTLRTIAGRRVPPDERSVRLARAADAGAIGLGALLLGLTLIGTVLCAAAALSRRTLPGVLRHWSFLPRAFRRPCP